MENNGASSSTVNHSQQQSLWLQQTLSDSNRRMQDIVTLLKEDENLSGKPEIHQAKRLQLFQMLDGFSDSYCSLAEMYDQLRSESENNLRLTTSFSNCKRSKPFKGNVDSIIEDSIVECDNANDDFEYLNTLVEELISNMMYEKNMDTRNNPSKEKAKDGRDSWSKLNFQVSELMHENFQKLAELARRNIEKKVRINRLQLQLENLTTENMALESALSQQKVKEKQNHFQFPKLKRLVSSKFFKFGS